LGKVRPEKVKKVSKQLVKLLPGKFTANFESNKKVLSSIMQLSSPKLRNRIAGYITRLVVIAQTETEIESKQAEVAGAEEIEEGEKGTSKI
jgi:small subunit ribosomal protein S17e